MDDLVTEALAHFMDDQKFVKDLAETAIPFLIRGIAHEVLIAGRKHLVFDGVIAPTAEVRKRVASKPWKFDGWTEHVGNQWHVKLIDMTGTDLDFAAEARESAGQDQIAKAEFLRTLRKKVGDDEKVSDKWSKTEIEKAYERIFNQ